MVAAVAAVQSFPSRLHVLCGEASTPRVWGESPQSSVGVTDTESAAGGSPG